MDSWLTKKKLSFVILTQLYRGSRCGVIAKELDCGLEVSEFERQSRYYVYFRTNTLEKSINHLIPPPAMC